MQLRKAKALGVLNDHDRGIGNVDADFDDGGGHENLDLIAAKFLHDVFFFFAGEAPVEQAELEFRENGFRKALVFLDGRFQLQFRFFDYGINDVALVASFDFPAEKFPHTGKMGFRSGARFDRSAAGRQFIEDGDFQIAVERERKRARNGCCGEDEDMGRVAVAGGFVHQSFAL